MAAVSEVQTAAASQGNVLGAAVRLLLTSPWRFLGCYLLWLIVVESLMFVPVLGFVIKLAVAGISSASLMFIVARMQAGDAAHPASLLFGFRLPVASQAMLAAVSVFQFGAGLVAVAALQGVDAVGFFLSATPLAAAVKPNATALLGMKLTMFLVALPFSFLAASCASAPAAAAGQQLRRAFNALRRCWPQLVLMTLFTAGLEAAQLALVGSGLGDPARIAAGVLAFLGLFVWLPISLALTWLLFQRSGQ